MSVRPHIRTFANAGALEALASGQTCLALTYSGDVIQARARAREAGQGVEVRYIAPKEGAQVAFDMLAIPADAPHREAALAFIDFVLRPPMMAAITNLTRYPNAVPATRPLLDPALLADPAVFPTEAGMRDFFTPAAVSQAAERARNRMWARFKAGKGTGTSPRVRARTCAGRGPGTWPGTWPVTRPAPSPQTSARTPASPCCGSPT